MGDYLIPTLIAAAMIIVTISSAWAGLQDNSRHPLVTAQSYVAAMWFLAATAAFAFTIVFLLAPQLLIALAFSAVGLFFFAAGVLYGRRAGKVEESQKAPPQPIS